MLETIAVLAVFFILLMLGFIFYTKVIKSGVEEEKEENIQLSAIKIAQQAAALPELQCSQNNVIKDNCVDRLKLEVADNIMQSPENEIFYYDKFSFSKITVEEIYPNTKEWPLYDRPLDDYTHTLVTHIPISIFNPENDENAFGLMEVESYLK